MRKKKGAIEYFTFSLLFITVCLFIVVGLRVRKIKLTNDFVSNGLVSANLAADVVNLDEFGKNREINITNVQNSYDLFSKALNKNLKLDKNFGSDESIIVNNKVNVDNFTIYNVKGKDVDVISIKPTYSKYTVNNGVGHLKTPNNVTIKATSVYSKISFSVKEILGEKKVSKECTTDITTRN